MDTVSPQNTEEHSNEKGHQSSSSSPISIKLHESTLGQEEIDAALKVLASGNITSGEKVREFESKFGPNAVMCNSGSSANLLAIAALCNPMAPEITGKPELRPGDEVIVPAVTWATSVWPLVQHGLVPVIVDIDPGTLNIDMAEAEKAIGPRTRAIMPVHVYGNPCQMADFLSTTLSDHNLWLIEDCCEALGASYFDGVDVAHYADMATYSFYFSHHITTLEGGMVVAANPEMAELLRILRAHGWMRDVENHNQAAGLVPIHSMDIDPRFLFVNAGYNLRSTELNAAIGLAQWPKLWDFLNSRRAAAKTLLKGFDRYKGFLRTQKPSGVSSWFGFPVTVSYHATFTGKHLRNHFESKGVETRPIICGNIARQPAMKLCPHRIVGDLHHADRVLRNGFSLPCHQGIGPAQIDYMLQVLSEFMEKNT